MSVNFASLVPSLGPMSQRFDLAQNKPWAALNYNLFGEALGSSRVCQAPLTLHEASGVFSNCHQVLTVDSIEC